MAIDVSRLPGPNEDDEGRPSGIDVSSLPAPPPLRQQTIGDYAKRFAQGAVDTFVSAPGAVVETMGGSSKIRQTGQALSGAIEESRSEQSRALDQQPLFDENWKVGANPGQKLVSAAVQSAPSLIQAFVAGRPIQQAMSRADVAGRVASGASKIGVPAKAGKVLGNAVEALPFAAVEGIAAGGMAAADLMKEIEEAPLEKLRAVPRFGELLGQTDASLPMAQREAQARKAMQQEAGRSVGADTAAWTGGVGFATGGGALGPIARRLSGKGSPDGFFRSVAKDAGKEMGQEAPQSGGEQYFGNVGRRDYLDPAQAPWENVGQAAVEGGLVGGMLGGGAGAVTYRRQPDMAGPVDPSGPIGAAVAAGQQSGAIPTNPVGGPVDGPSNTGGGGAPGGGGGPGADKQGALTELATLAAGVPPGSSVPPESETAKQLAGAVERAAGAGASLPEIEAALAGSLPQPSAFHQRQSWKTLEEAEAFLSQARQQSPDLPPTKPVQREDGSFTFAVQGEPEFDRLPDARQSPAASANADRQIDEGLRRVENLTKRLSQANDAARKAREDGDEETAANAETLAGMLRDRLDAARAQLERLNGSGANGGAVDAGAAAGDIGNGDAGAARGLAVDGRRDDAADPAAGATGGIDGLPAPAAGAPADGGGARPVVLQNRDRSSAASVAQMASIAGNPDPRRLSFSRDFGTGAPVVFANADAASIPDTQLGAEGEVVDAAGRAIPVRYAVVDANEVVPSNRADGTPNDLYADAQTPGLIRAVAGNGRMAGLQEAFNRGTAAGYVEGIAADSRLHGVDPEAIRAMRNPVLVRLMRSDDVTPDIGDRSNVSGISQLDPVEQARTDVARVNLEGLDFNEDGSPTIESVRRFIRAMPASEQSGLMDPSGAPGRQAVDRLMAAAFAKAYQSDDLVRLYAQATDPEARNVLSALAQVAGAMARLDGAGIYDIRPVVVDAARAAVNASRRGVSLARLAQQDDMTMAPDTARAIKFLEANARSAKRIAEGLRSAADAFYNEATKADTDMFGAVPRRAPAEIYGELDGQEAGAESPTDQQPGGPGLPGAGAAGQAGREDRAGASQDGRADPGQDRPADGQADDFSLTAPTPEDIRRQQEAADRAAQGEQTDDEARARLDAEREAADQVGFLQPPPSGTEQRDTTGDMFGGPTADDVLAQRERERRQVPDTPPTIFGLSGAQIEAMQGGRMSGAENFPGLAPTDEQRAAAANRRAERQQAEREALDEASTDPRIAALREAGVEAGSVIKAANELRDGDDSLLRDLARIHGVNLPAPVDAAAAQAATSPSNDAPEPTEGQREAGNYRKGHARVAGLDIAIENEAGTRRRPEWPPLAAHYGYVKRTEGADGDQVDVFIKPGTPEDFDGAVFVIDQMVDGRFDEHKVMLGYPNQPAAAKAYRDSYTKGWKGMGPVRRMSMDEFKAWLADGDTTAPAATPATSPAEPVAEPTNDEQKNPAPAKRRPKKADPLAAVADYFTPGNIVPNFGGGFDRVLEFTPGEDGRWSVRVQGVRKDGDAWVPVEGERARVHSTAPSGREMAKGPVERGEAHARPASAESVPVFATYADAQAWIKERSKAAGGQGKFTSTDEYKQVFPQIRALYEAENAASAEAAMKRFTDAGMKIGDRVKMTIPGMFLGPGRTVTGTVVSRGGRPVVKIDGDMDVSRNGRISTVKSIAWDGRWTKDESQSQEAAPAAKKPAGPFTLPNPWSLTQDEFVKKVDFRKGTGSNPWSAFWGEHQLEAGHEEFNHPDLGKTVVSGGRFFRTKREAEITARGAHKRAVRRAMLNGERVDQGVLQAYPDLLEQADKDAKRDTSPDLDEARRVVKDGRQGKLKQSLLKSAIERAEAGDAGDLASRLAASKAEIEKQAKKSAAEEDASEAEIERLAQAIARADTARVIERKLRELNESRGTGTSSDLAWGTGGGGNYIRDLRVLERALEIANSAPPAKKKPAGPIADVGEQLHANRRNFVGRGLKWDDLAGMNDTLKVKEVKKAKVWPKPDYEKLIAEGMPAVLARMVKHVYDGLGAGPTIRGTPTDADLKRYIDTIHKVREAIFGFAEDREALTRFAGAVQGMIDRERQSGPMSLMADMQGNQSLSEILLARVWPEEMALPRAGRFRRGSDANAEALTIGGNRALSAMQFDRNDLAKWAKDIAEGWPAKREAWQVQGYRVIAPGDYTVGDESQVTRYNRETGESEPTGETYFGISAKGLRKTWRMPARPADGEHLLVDENGSYVRSFASEADAVEAARALVKREKGVGQDNRGTNIADSERKGPARRQEGEDISSERLMETFGFRGVNFGREGWIKQAERQAYLNAAYDGLMDLAEVLGVPPRAMSLNGMLGIAFGAQGKGQFAAHFVPGHNEINLTKTRGAGTLAHEWGHALDHHFATQAGLATDAEPMVSEHADQPDTRKRMEPGPDGKLRTVEVPTFSDGIRPEIVQAFRAIVQAMSKRPENEGEAKLRQAQAIARARSLTDRRLANARAEIASSRHKDAERLLAEFDRHAEAIRGGEPGEGYVESGNLALSPRVADIRELAKQATGRLLPKEATEGLQTAARWLRSDLGKKEAADTHEPQTFVSTEYASESGRLDAAKSKTGKKRYWSTPTEMFARAFETYVHERLAAAGQVNTFLTDAERLSQEMVEVPDNSSASARGAGATRLIHAYPYPRGVERETINRAFDTLIEAIETRETDTGVAMFSRSAATQQAFEARIDALFAGAKATTGTRVLDSSDVMGLLGFPEVPMVLNESHLQDGIDSHPEMTAAIWKKVPQWLESPAVAYEDRGRIVMVGPELVAGYPVRLVIEPNPGTPQRGKAGGASSESLLVTVFAKTTPPFLPSVDRLASDGTLRFLHMQNAPEIWRRAGAQFPRQAALSLGRKKILTEKNLAGYRRNRGGAMSRAAAGTGLPVANVTRLADAIRRTWANAPEVVVVADLQDPKVPPRVREYDAEQRSQGAEGEPEGFYYGGRVYLVAGQLGSPADVVRVLAHEALGHHGLRGFFGGELSKILDQIAVVRRNEVNAKRNEYGLPDTVAGRRVAAEEVLAVMAQTNPQLGFVRRAVAAIRAWLRGLGVKLRMSDNDIVAQFIIPARQWVQRGGDVGAEGAPVATFSRAQARGDVTPLGFYSELARRIEAGPGRADAANWKAFIRSQKGVKPDEIAWTGIEEFLDLQQGKIPKEAVREFLAANGVRVEEVVLGKQRRNPERAPLIERRRALLDRRAALPADVEEGARKVKLGAVGSAGRYTTWGASLYRAERDATGRLAWKKQGTLGRTASGSRMSQKLRDELTALAREEGIEIGNVRHNEPIAKGDEARQIDDELAAIERDLAGIPAMLGDKVKFSSYTIPGGTNYREVLLTLPPRADTDGLPNGYQIIDEGDGRWSFRGPSVSSRIFKTREAAVEAARKDAGQERANGAGIQWEFRSGHWDQPNVVAHVRIDERTDADGKRVLFVHELQSDWGQQGRREGFADPNSPIYAVFAKSGAFLRSFENQQEADAFAETVSGEVRAERRQRGDDSRPPAAPFVEKTDAWVALALKRVIRMAAEEGFDRVAFVTGEQAADLFDLSKQVDRIAVTPTGGVWAVTAWKDGTRVVSKDARNESELAELVGKEIAERAIKEGGGDYTGLDLKVGGKGMRAFYDRIVPTVLKDVLKKVGGPAPASIEIPAQREISTNIDDGAGGVVKRKQMTGAMLTQPGFDITPQMRDTVLEQGMPLFSRRPTAESVQAAVGQAAQALRGATLEGAWRRAVNAWTDKKPLSLQLLGRRQIVEVYGDLLPHLQAYSNEMQQYDADKNESAAVADELVNRWRKLRDADALADVMHDATLLEFDPDVDNPANDPDRAALRDRFNALTDGAKGVYREARDAYREHWENVKAAIRSRIERAQLGENERRAMMEEFRDQFMQPIRGVYFPLARFGDYVITAVDAEGQRVVVFAETLTEAQAEHARLAREYPEVGKVTLRKEYNAAQDAVSKAFVRKLFETVDENAADGAEADLLKDAINQLYLTSLPDVSWAKHGIHRKGTPGYSKDARRAFAANMFHGGYYLSKLKHADVLQDYLRAMQEHIDGQRAVADYDSITAQQVVNEMVKRHDATMNPDNSAVANTLTGLGFVWFLGLSPSSAIVNLSQTALVAYPIIAARFGYGKTADALTRASKEALQFKNDLRGRYGPEENEAVARAVREGLIDITQAHDLAGIAEGRDSQLRGGLSPVMRAASWMFHQAEKFNRQATFIAAYRLAREAGEGAEQAYDTARELTYKGHFDYSSSNRPRVMMGPVARVALLFKQYGQNMIYTLARNAYLSAKGDRQALRALSGILVGHALAAGVLGLPLASVLMGAASLLGGSDDEPWDAEVAFRNYLADGLGPTMGEVVSKGVFRAFFPGDIASRVGLDSLLIRDIDLTLEPNKVWQEILSAVIGPVGGIAANAAYGAGDLARGDLLRGLQGMMPKAIADGFKTLRYWRDDGVVDRTGIEVLDTVTARDMVAQVMGFSPARVAEAYAGRRAVMSAKRAVDDRRESLLRTFSTAVIDKNHETRLRALQEIQHFNASNPTAAITPQSMLRSVQNRMRRRAEAESGVYLPRPQRGLLELGRFANAN